MSTQSREMERLNDIRNLYTRHLTSHLKSKSVDEVLFHSHHKESEFLEKNLEELEKEHKKVWGRDGVVSRKQLSLQTASSLGEGEGDVVNREVCVL